MRERVSGQGTFDRFQVFGIYPLQGQVAIEKIHAVCPVGMFLGYLGDVIPAILGPQAVDSLANLFVRVHIV